MREGHKLIFRRVKLPKSFIAVNLSDAFTFEEQERQNSDADALEMKGLQRIASPTTDIEANTHSDTEGES